MNKSIMIQAPAAVSEKFSHKRGLLVVNEGIEMKSLGGVLIYYVMYTWITLNSKLCNRFSLFLFPCFITFLFVLIGRGGGGCNSHNPSSRCTKEQQFAQRKIDIHYRKSSSLPKDATCYIWLKSPMSNIAHMRNCSYQ